MSLASMLSLLGTIQTVGSAGVDRYNQPTETVTTTTANVPYRLEQTESTEVTAGEATAISDWKLFLLPTAVISHRDRFIDANTPPRTFEVVGAPSVERTPRGPHHIECRLRFVA